MKTRACIFKIALFVLALVVYFTNCNIAAAYVDLTDNAGFTYDIDTWYGDINNGEGNGLSDAFDDGYDLSIDGTQYNNFSGAYTLEDSGREVVLPVVPMSGLEVSRKIFVPDNSNFARHLNILHNPTGSPITVDVKVYGELGSDEDTTLDKTSTGDPSLDTSDRWMVTDGDSGDPRIAHLWDGIGGSDSVDTVSLRGDYYGDEFDWTWNSVTVPSGETVIYMTYTVMQTSVINAIDRARNLDRLLDPAMSAGMSSAELNQVKNWPSLQDTDGDGLPDGWELFYFGDLSHNGSVDTDSDGLTDLEEYQNGSDPTEIDTDQDGLNDPDEVNTYNTDPGGSDSDGDRLIDGYEVLLGKNPLDSSDGAIWRLTNDAEISDQPDIALD
ncbi:hypothetical protein ACFLZG_02670, partial [Thermodesulfobacteriota bacterium]